MSSVINAINATNAALVDIQRDKIDELVADNQRLKDEIAELRTQLDKQELLMSFISKDKKELIPTLQNIVNKA